MVIHLSTLVLLLAAGVFTSPASAAAPATSVAPNLALPKAGASRLAPGAGRLPSPLAGYLSLPGYDQKTNTSFPPSVVPVSRRSPNPTEWRPEVRPGNRDLTDCRREPPASITLPGMEDYSSQFRSGVVWIQGRLPVPGGTRFSFCSGALIHPRIVLTAAHCLVNSTTGRRLSATYSMVAVAHHNSDWDDLLEADDAVEVPFAYDVVYNKFLEQRSVLSWNLEGTDIAIAVLQAPGIQTGYTFGWAAATSIFGSTQIRAQVGYPAASRDVIGYQVASTNSRISTVRRGVTCGPGYSSSIICEDLQCEGGNSGGPLMVTVSGLVLGVVSNVIPDGCPVYYKDLFGTYNLDGLLRTAGCTVTRSGSDPTRYYYRVPRSCTPIAITG